MVLALSVVPYIENTSKSAIIRSMDKQIEIAWQEGLLFKESYFRERYSKTNPGIEFATIDVRKTAKLLTGRPTDWEGLKGKKILDLGCGSRLVPLISRPGVYTPYYCLLCARAGVDIYGIDLQRADPLDNGVYKHIQADLVEIAFGPGLASLPEISLGQFDVIHSLRFAYNPPPNVYKELERRRKTWQDLYKQLESQSCSLLKDGGYLIFENGSFKKTGSSCEHQLV